MREKYQTLKIKKVSHLHEYNRKSDTYTSAYEPVDTIMLLALCI